MDEDIAAGIAIAIALGGPIFLIIVGAALYQIAAGLRAKWENSYVEEENE
jgi:hypothetical protein